MGWKSSRGEIGRFLSDVGADRDENGRFLLSWPQGGRGLGRRRRGGEARIVIDDDVLYRIRGRWARLGPAVRRNRPEMRTLWSELEPPTSRPEEAAVSESGSARARSQSSEP